MTTKLFNVRVWMDEVINAYKIVKECKRYIIYKVLMCEGNEENVTYKVVKCREDE